MGKIKVSYSISKTMGKIIASCSKGTIKSNYAMDKINASYPIIKIKASFITIFMAFIKINVSKNEYSSLIYPCNQLLDSDVLVCNRTVRTTEIKVE